MSRLWGAGTLLLGLLYHSATAQVIEFESHGLKYQTLTRSGITVMFAPLPVHVREYAILQIAVSNGSAGPYIIKPEDFYYLRNGGEIIQASPANAVVGMLMQKGSGSDVIKLVNTYENALYGIPNMKSTNGYEQRRQGAMAYGINAKLKAAATASAIALAQVRLPAGQSTDGAVFFPLAHDMKNLTGGHIVFRAGGETFEFNMD